VRGGLCFVRAGGVLRERTEAVRLVHDGGRIAGCWVCEAGAHDEEPELLAATQVVVCAGAWSRLLMAVELPREAVPPIRPVKGQVLALEMSHLLHLDHVVRTRDVYLAPKSDGRLVVGATSEERGFDTRLTAGGVLDLLRDAWAALPGIHDLHFLDAWAGLRPATRDNAPVLGATPVDGLFLAAGHYRNGVLLTPITAHAMGELLLEGRTPEVIRPFGLHRFFSRRERS
jgi:glycine oxidase